MAQQGQLQGKLAIVTGGGKGIGRSVCQLFAQEGATVVAVALHLDGVKDTVASLPPGNHKAFAVDVSSASAVTDLFEQVKVIYGDLVPSVVVCCAGNSLVGHIIDYSEEDLDRTLAVHVKGTFLVMQAAARRMIESHVTDGTIITVSSILTAGLPEFAAYSAAKAGIEALTKSAAKEWGRVPIRCNVVSPGAIDTPMLRSEPEEAVQGVADATPMGRIGKPEEIASVCLFLATKASSFMTGAVVDASGGYGM